MSLNGNSYDIRCCKDCPPETRYRACHDTCKRYIRERNMLDFKNSVLRRKISNSQQIHYFNY